MAGIQAIPLDLACIGDGVAGSLEDELAAALEKLGNDIYAYQQRWGERAKGKKAKLTVTVDLAIDKENEAICHVAGSVSLKLPTAPKRYALATSVLDGGGSPMLASLPIGNVRDVRGQTNLLVHPNAGDDDAADAADAEAS